MEFNQIQIHPGETILYRITSNNKWYIIIWKIGSGIAGIALLVFILFSLLGDPTQSAASSFLPAWLASLLTKILYLGLVPLTGLAWVAEDLASTYLGEFILTDQRIWVRGSPYAWSQSDTKLEDIASMIWRRDAIFIRKKSVRGLQVHVFSEGKQIVRTYEQLTGKNK
jgi:hypothetical protein